MSKGFGGGIILKRTKNPFNGGISRILQLNEEAKRDLLRTGELGIVDGKERFIQTEAKITPQSSEGLPQKYSKER